VHLCSLTIDTLRIPSARNSVGCLWNHFTSKALMCDTFAPPFFHMELLIGMQMSVTYKPHIFTSNLVPAISQAVSCWLCSFLSSIPGGVRRGLWRTNLFEGGFSQSFSVSPANFLPVTCSTFINHIVVAV
jgi:hypothetical protein